MSSLNKAGNVQRTLLNTFGTEASIKAWVDIHVFRVRVTTSAPIDTSYKTAATFQVSFSAIDPQRVDKLVYKINYRAA